MRNYFEEEQVEAVGKWAMQLRIKCRNARGQGSPDQGSPDQGSPCQGSPDQGSPCQDSKFQENEECLSDDNPLQQLHPSGEPDLSRCKRQNQVRILLPICGKQGGPARGTHVCFGDEQREESNIWNRDGAEPSLQLQIPSVPTQGLPPLHVCGTPPHLKKCHDSGREYSYEVARSRMLLRESPPETREWCNTISM